MSSRSRTLVGIGYLILAVACFATLDTTVKLMSASLSLLIMLWFRYAIQAILSTAILWPGRGRKVLFTHRPGLQFMRAVLLLGCSLLAFGSLKFMPVGEFTAIALLAPLSITLVAAWLFKEHVSGLRWLLVLGGFVGTLMIIQPSRDDFQWALLLPLGLVVVNTGFQLMTRELARTEDPMTTHLYTSWIGTGLMTLALPWVWEWPSGATLWALLIFSGVMGALGHFILILAYARAPAPTLTPFMYAQIGFGVLGGWLVFSHVPDHWAALGMALIALCGALGAWLTVREGRIRVDPPEI